MILPLIVIGFVGYFLASLVSLSFALALGRLWRRPPLLPDFGATRTLARAGTRLPSGLVFDGFQLVFETYLLASTVTSNPIQGPVLA